MYQILNGYTYKKFIMTKNLMRFIDSDIFLSPSTGCNGPATIRESIVNDLPVIAFDHGSK